VRRESVLPGLVRPTQEALAARMAGPEHLAALRRLETADVARTEGDPVLHLAGLFPPVFKGELPVDYGERILTGWDEAPWWGRGQRARLRILLCDAAFTAGWQPRDLRELGRIAPRFGEAVASEDLPGLARLRWLWELRTRRGWQSVGAATAVFELARYPILGEQHLEERPDLLLFAPIGEEEMEQALSTPIRVCEEGVVYRDVVLTAEMPRPKVRARPLWLGGGYELTYGPLHVLCRQGPLILARRLEAWVDWLFTEFLPQAEGVRAWRSGERLERVARQKLVACPECGGSFLPLPGDVGLALADEAEEAARGSERATR
jgi:hypothetical protein